MTSNNSIAALTILNLVGLDDQGSKLPVWHAATLLGVILGKVFQANSMSEKKYLSLLMSSLVANDQLEAIAFSYYMLKNPSVKFSEQDF